MQPRLPAKTVLHSQPRGIFVDSDDSIYFGHYSNNEILRWSHHNDSVQSIMSWNLSEYSTLFVSINKDIYFVNSAETGRVDKVSTSSSAGSELVARFDGDCYGLFIDLNNTLYCSVRDNYTIVSLSLSLDNNISTTVAGTGVKGSASDQLDSPWGIFVDVNFDLYVADAGNNRIQRFQLGQLNGTTVAGNGTPDTLMLNYPTDVILDANGYLYIADNVNNRIIRASLSDYECIAGCNGTNGSSPSQLSQVFSLRFDSEANIYVADEFNTRIQKFLFLVDSCSKYRLNMRMTGVICSLFDGSFHLSAATYTTDMSTTSLMTTSLTTINTKESTTGSREMSTVMDSSSSTFSSAPESTAHSMTSSSRTTTIESSIVSQKMTTDMHSSSSMALTTSASSMDPMTSSFTTIEKSSTQSQNMKTNKDSLSSIALTTSASNIQSDTTSSLTTVEFRTEANMQTTTSLSVTTNSHGKDMSVGSFSNDSSLFSNIQPLPN